MPLKMTYQDRDYYPERYLANLEDGLFHDMENPNLKCNIVDIIDKRQDRAYEFKIDAKKDGYIPCLHCMPDEQEK